MKTTGNYGLKKPDGNDVVNIENFNYNSDVIDRKLKEVETKASDIKVPVTSVNGQTGKVALTSKDIAGLNNLSVEQMLLYNKEQLTNLGKKQGDLSTLKTNNKNNIVGALNEVFTNANNGKKLISDVVGSPLLATDSFKQQKDKIQSLKNELAKNTDNDYNKDFCELIDETKNVFKPIPLKTILYDFNFEYTDSDDGYCAFYCNGKYLKKHENNDRPAKYFKRENMNYTRILDEKFINMLKKSPFYIGSNYFYEYDSVWSDKLYKHIYVYKLYNSSPIKTISLNFIPGGSHITLLNNKFYIFSVDKGHFSEDDKWVMHILDLNGNLLKEYNLEGLGAYGERSYNTNGKYIYCNEYDICTINEVTRYDEQLNRLNKGRVKYPGKDYFLDENNNFIITLKTYIQDYMFCCLKGF